jgi:hypothetical protein
MALTFTGLDGASRWSVPTTLRKEGRGLAMNNRVMASGAHLSLSLPPSLDAETHRVVQSSNNVTDSKVFLEALTEADLA